MGIGRIDALGLYENGGPVVIKFKKGSDSGVSSQAVSYRPTTVELEEGFTRDMRGIGHLGTGDLEVRIVSAADLEKAAPLIRRAFEAA
ncbi:hypothetical protein AB0B46_28395 [Streptomyces diastaticus]